MSNVGKNSGGAIFLENTNSILVNQTNFKKNEA